VPHIGACALQVRKTRLVEKHIVDHGTRDAACLYVARVVNAADHAVMRILRRAIKNCRRLFWHHHRQHDRIDVGEGRMPARIGWIRWSSEDGPHIGIFDEGPRAVEICFRQGNDLRVIR
jgi:hypothetical protein